jgi:hypothetical protein
MRVPKNIIVTSKYTQGNEYMYKDTQESYQGYYYELNDKLFAGKEFDVYSLELLRITPSNINTFLTKASTYVYGAISGVKILNTLTPSVALTNESDEETYLINKSDEETYYTRKINETPYSIKQITKETYTNTLKDPIYQSVILKPDYSNIDQAEQQIPGLKAFLGLQ